MTKKNCLIGEQPFNWRATLLKLGSTIEQAIQSLENSRAQIVLAVSENNKLAGTLTDGDIRRAFLRGAKLQTYIDNLINRKPLVVPPEITRDFVLQLMTINKIHQLPIVNENNEVLGIHLLDYLIEPVHIPNIMIIMAGGKGSRLYPHTEKCPKPMLEVNGKPILEHIIERAKAKGFQNFFISLHHLGHVIQDYFGNGDKLGIKIDYLQEDFPLGTAGCLSILPTTPKLPFVITNGDVLSDINYNELLDYHLKHDADGTMSVRQHEIQNQFGVVHTKGIKIDGFEEKPKYTSYVNAGIYVLKPDSLKLLNYKQHCDMPTLFERIKENNGLTIVYPIHEPWLDVGRQEDLTNARQIYSQKVI